MRKLLLPIIIIVVTIVVLARLFFLQIVDDTYIKKSENNALKIVYEYPERGYVFDRNKKLLIANQPSYDIMVIPRAVSYTHLDVYKRQILGAVAGAKHVHALAEAYGVTVILHTDHCAKKLLPWIDGLLEAGEEHMKQFGKPLFSSHMIDLSEEPIKENIEISKQYLERMDKLGMTLEIELGITGGEEDGVDNTDVDSSRLYTQPEEVDYAFEELSKVSKRFTIAASFGNVHGVYKPGNVKLTPVILKNSQEYVAKKHNLGHNPVDFVFHGGSGSSVEEIREAIGYGVIKMNIDTDTQFAYTEGVRDYMTSKIDYLKTQIGNPEGSDVPNKKYYDPRVWVRQGELTLIARLEQAFEDLNNVNTL